MNKGVKSPPSVDAALLMANAASEVFRAFVKCMGSSLIVGSAYHKNTYARVERASTVIGSTLRAYANGRKDDWDDHLTWASWPTTSTSGNPSPDRRRMSRRICAAPVAVAVERVGTACALPDKRST